MKMKSRTINEKTPHTSSSETYDSKWSQKQPLCKITVNLEQQEYSIEVYQHSSIKKLSLKLIVMLYENMLEQQFNEQLNLIHQKVCQMLIQSLNATLKKYQNQNQKQWSDAINHIIKQYYQQKNKLNFTSPQPKNKYFIGNYLKTLQQKQNSEDQNCMNKPRISNNRSQPNILLYQKSQKSLQRKVLKQNQRHQQKNKLEISYCTFHPNISKSQKKFKSKQKDNVFERLYSDADEIRIKNCFKKRQFQNQEEIKNSSFKYTPEINQCSKQIVKLKQINQSQQLLQSFQKSKISLSPSEYSAKKLLNVKKSNNKFQNLSDSNFYQNRLNRTLQKLNLNQQNECSFQPQLSQGTKRITKDYPVLQQRLKIYQMKKTQNHQSSPCFSTSQQKSFKKSLSKTKTVKSKEKVLANKNVSKTNETKNKQNIKIESKQKRQTKNKENKSGIRKFLNRIKTQPLSQIENTSNYFQSRQKINKFDEQNLKKYQSSFFNVQNNFIDDEQIFEITPKKLNMNDHESKYFFKQKSQTKKQLKPSKISSSTTLPLTIKQKNINEKNKLLNEKNKLVLEQNDVKRKQQIFNKIFTHLCNSEEQVYDTDITKNTLIPFKIKQIFQPLTRELQQMQTSLDKDEFVWSLQNLYRQLDLQTKANFLAWGLKLFHFSNNETNYKNVFAHGQRGQNNQRLHHIKTEDSIFQLVE